MNRTGRAAIIGAVGGAILVGISGALLGFLVVFNACGSTTDVNVYGFCAARLLGVPISAALGVAVGLCPTVLFGALAGGAIGALIGRVRSKDDVALSG